MLKNLEITKLPNGIRVITERIPYVDSFSLGFLFDVGAIDEDVDNNGISHFLEHMFFKGTAKRSAKRISDDIESSGGYLNAFTTKEHTCFYGRGLSKNLTKTFSVLADMLQNSLFRENDIRKEAGVVVDELYDIEDTPEELVFEKFESNIFDGNPLALPIIGTEDNIKGFTNKQLSDYVDKYYGFDNLVIAASGNVKHKRILELIERWMVKDLGKTAKKRTATVLHNVQDISLVKDVQQTHMVMGCPSFGFGDTENRTRVNILNQILGEGSSSRLFQRVRERNGIAYQINSFLNSFYEISTFGVYISTNHSSFEKAYRLIFEEFEKLKAKPVGEKELKRAKEYLKGSIIMSLESTTNRMIRMAQSMLYFDRVKSVEETCREIDAVSNTDIIDLANKLLAPENLSKVIISSKNFSMLSAA